MTVDDLLGELSAVVAPGHARALISRARRVAGVGRDEALDTTQLLMVLEAVATEGGALQEVAETLARRALDRKPRR